MSYYRFPRQHPPSNRTERSEASDKNRYKTWCRRKPLYIKVQRIPLTSPAAAKKCNIPTYYLPAQQKPTYRNTTLGYLRSHTTEGKEAYEWVNQGCLIGLREI